MNATETPQRHDEAFNAQDAEGRMAVEAPDIEAVLPGGLSLRGSDQLLQVVRAFWEALPDARIVNENRFVAGDAVVSEGILTGTHTGTFRAPPGDVPPSGKLVSLRFASVKQIRDGRVAQEHLYFDQLEFLQQIGAVPEPGGRPSPPSA